MALIADFLLASGALGVGFYCYILSRRLRKFNDLESGVGGAVAVLSSQVDDLTQMLKKAQSTATNSTRHLEDVTEKGELVTRKLELLIASLSDLEDKGVTPQKGAKETAHPPKVESVDEETVPESEAESDDVLFSSRRSSAEAA